MGEDASLDQFLTDASDEGHSESETGAEEPEPTASEAGGEQSETDAATESGPRDDPEPATTTYAWDGAGAECAACGDAVERRWQQDGGLVCADCKAWDRA